MLPRCFRILCKRRFSSSSGHALSVSSQENFQPVIGLEVHVQLNTKTKLFSRAPCAQVAGPNANVELFDMAVPGTLPILNEAAVKHALRLALLLNCQVPRSCSFDRKHYFYADMPAGFQITQSSNPIAKSGIFGFYVFGETVPAYWKEVDIMQLQLEQDSGKTLHHGEVSLIDLNRAGTALVEVVTAPSFSTALEAVCFVQQLRLILMHYGICEGEMHNGQLRVDANVSLSANGNEGVRTEVKNMNSLRHLHTAINYEINRQYELLAEGGIVINETRACDAQGRTVSMRDKEEETDYRIVAEPNLPHCKVKKEWVDTCRGEIKLSLPTYQNLISLGFDPRTAVHFAEEPLLCKFVSNCSESLNKITPDQFIKALRDLKLIMQRSKEIFPPQSKFFAKQFIDVVHCLEQEKITKLRAIETLRSYVNNAELREAVEVFSSEDLWKIVDSDQIDDHICNVFAENDEIVRKATNGNAKAITRLKNLVVNTSQKKIDVNVIEKRIKEKLLLDL